MVYDVGVMCKLKGCRVRLKVNNEEYEGIVINVVAATSCVALGKARCLTDEVFHHVLYFYTYEIESCITLNGPENLEKISKKSNTCSEEDGPRLVKLRPLPFNERGKTNINVDTGNILIEGIEDKKQIEYLLDDLSGESGDYDDDILSSEKLKYVVPDKNIIIDTINDDFHQAITSIMKETVVGISLEGGIMGRHGKVCWILVSTENIVYLFDVCTLGKDVFDKGLKNVLQNPDIMKIFHDCREPSDALFHQFGVRLVNIFDTQSSDALLHYKLHHKMPRFVRSLHACLLHYLKLNVRILNVTTCHRQYPEKNLSIWMNRPLLRKYVKAAAKRCMFLKELRYAILERYIADLNHGAEIFLSIVRDSSEQELSLSQNSLHMLPEVFQKLEVKSKKDTHNRQSFEASFVDDNYFKSSLDPFAAADTKMWFKKNSDHPITVRTCDKEHLKNFESQHIVDNKSGISDRNFDTNTESNLFKINCSSCTSVTEKNSVLASCVNHLRGTSSQFEEQSSSVLSKHENRMCARTYPKKRIDWPKVYSQRVNGNTNITVIPAGMVPPSLQYPKEKQGS